MKLNESGFNQFYKKESIADSRAYSAADFDSFMEDQSITPEKLDTSATSTKEETLSSSLKVKDSQGNTVELITLDGSDYINIGNSVKGVKVFNKNLRTRVRLISPSITILNNIPTKITFNNTDYNYNSGYNLSSNIFTAPISGYYLISFNIRFWWSGSLSGRREVRIMKNGAEFGNFNHTSASANDELSVSGSDILSLDSGDLIELYGFQNSGGTNYIVGRNSLSATFLSIHLLSA